MTKLELRQALGRAVDDLQNMAGLSVSEGFNEALYHSIQSDIADLQRRVARAENAERAAASAAAPAYGFIDPERFPPSPRRDGKIKNFVDREIGGKLVRAAEQAYTAGMWFKGAVLDDAEAKNWCASHGVAITKTQGENVDSAGGYLVPEEMMANIIVLREQFGVFRQECQVVPMAGDSQNWPRRTGGLTAAFFSQGENTAATESQASWDNVNLTTKKLGVLTRISNEIAEDAVISVGDWLVGEIAYAFAAKEDDCGFNGDGTSTYGGIRGVTFLATDGSHSACNVTASNSAWSSLAMKDFTGVIGKLPQYAIGGAKWFTSQQFFTSVIGGIAAGAGGNNLDTLSQPIAPRFLGFPVVRAQKLPITAPGSGKVVALFGNLRQAALMGDRRRVTIMQSGHRYLEFDQTGIRGTERFDLNVHDMGDGTTVGPMVALVSP